MDPLDDIRALVESHHPLLAIETDEEERLVALLGRLARQLSIPLHVWSSVAGFDRPPPAQSGSQTTQPLAALATVAGHRAEALFLFKDLHRFLGDTKVVRKLLDLVPALSRSRRAIVLTAPHLDLPSELRPLTALVQLALPSRPELAALLHATLRDLRVRRPVRVTLEAGDEDRLVTALQGLSLFDAERALTRAIVEDGALTVEDVERVIEAKRKVIQRDGVLELWPRTEGFADVGGLGRLKAWLHARRDAFSERARDFGLEPPRGILLLGVQGCGKSLCAKAVARDWSLPLLRMDPGRLYDKYVGESERNLRKALDLAARLAPVVLWIDEIEKGFAATTQSETDAGLSRRLFGTFLSWLQDRPAAVFVAASCNDVRSLPPELMRKGRFDEVFFVDLPDRGERREIFAIHLRRRGRDPATFDLDGLADATPGFSGAEIEQAVVGGLYLAFSQERALETAHVVAEVAGTRPLSVLRAEDVDALRSWAAGRAVPAR